MTIHRHKFGPVQTDGYQYCQKCGIATRPLPTRLAPCEQHDWREIDRFERVNALTGHYLVSVYVMRCAVCGEMEEKRVGWR